MTHYSVSRGSRAKAAYQAFTGLNGRPSGTATAVVTVSSMAEAEKVFHEYWGRGLPHPEIQIIGNPKAAGGADAQD